MSIDYEQCKADIEWARRNGFTIHIDPEKWKPDYAGSSNGKPKKEKLTPEAAAIVAKLKRKDCPASIVSFVEYNGGPRKAWPLITSPAWLIWMIDALGIASSTEIAKIKSVVADRAKRVELSKLMLHQCCFRSATIIAARSLMISAKAENSAYKSETLAQCDIIRSIVNNPFNA